jgi:lipopolysaccharide biosynthesis glycosyltransferase
VNSQTRIRVFIGSGEASRIERKTAIYSLRKNSKRELDVYVFNGTHNSVQLNDGEPFLAPMSLRVKYQNITEFSLYRYLIPELCDYQGRAIYIDSDTVCLSDIGELLDNPMGDADFLARRDTNPDEERWGLSVMLIDCQRCRFDLEMVVDEIDAGLYSLTDFS